MCDTDASKKRTLKVKLPCEAIALERNLRTHCEHHGVWDKCKVVVSPHCVKANTDRMRKLSADLTILVGTEIRELLKTAADDLDLLCGRINKRGN